MYKIKIYKIYFLKKLFIGNLLKDVKKNGQKKINLCYYGLSLDICKIIIKNVYLI